MQRTFNFMAVLQAPKNAPFSILSKIETPDQAIRVSVMQKGIKAAYYAHEMHISEGYFSRIASGARSIPEWFVEPFCALSGSNLLKQYLALQEALHQAAGDLDQKASERRLASELRVAA